MVWSIFEESPPRTQTGGWRADKLPTPSENSGGVKKLRRLRQIFSRLMARLNEPLPSARAPDFQA
jgi:hypothetical protein